MCPARRMPRLRSNMENHRNSKIRNLAIIAHVDHGKTTLVDALLKQSKVFRAGQQVGELIMDTNPLERERGITILAKNAAVTYKGVKINIIDTPGHADFSGEVERIMNMADGCLLLVDAVDGPMPQTTYVLRQALRQNVTPMVVINKIDRPEARVPEVVDMVQEHVLATGHRPGATGLSPLCTPRPGRNMPPQTWQPRGRICRLSLTPYWSLCRRLLETRRDLLQLLVAALDYDNYLGQVAIGRVFRGTVRLGDQVALVSRDGQVSSHKLQRVFVFRGLERLEVEEAIAGDIIALTGVEGVSIGDTVAALDQAEALPPIEIDEPTVKMTFGINTSPFMGKEGTYCTSRMLHDRLTAGASDQRQPPGGTDIRSSTCSWSPDGASCTCPSWWKPCVVRGTSSRSPGPSR